MSGEANRRVRPKAQVEVRLVGSCDNDDYHRIKAREGTEDWVFLCQELADADYAYAEDQLARGRPATARYFFSAAISMYMLAGYGLTDLTDEKLGLYRRQADSAARFAGLGPNSFEAVKIPYHGFDMDGWLVTPRNMPTGYPVMIIIPGATAFKDSFIRGMDGWLTGGFATLLMDGPGQGTTRYFNNGYLEVETEQAHRAMIDFLEADGRFGKIGIYGGSTGGYYVARTAGVDPRLAVCAINGGSYTPVEILDYSPEYRHKFAVLSGVEDDAMDSVFPRMTLDGLAENITCPLLVLHGGADPVFKPASAKRIVDAARSADKTFVAFPGAWHCCAGAGSKAQRLTLDWLSEHLRG